MKNLLILILLFLPFSVGFGMDEPLTYSQAYNKAKVENKKLLIVFSRPMCLACNYLKEDLASSIKLSSIKTKYIVLKKTFNRPEDLEPRLLTVYRYTRARMVPHSISIDVKRNVYDKQHSGYSRSNNFWLDKFK